MLDLDRKRSRHQTKGHMATPTQVRQSRFPQSLTLLHCPTKNSELWDLKCRTFQSQVPIPKILPNKDGTMHMRTSRLLNLSCHHTLRFPPTKLTFLLLTYPFLQPTAPSQTAPINHLHTGHHDPHPRTFLRPLKYHKNRLRHHR